MSAVCDRRFVAQTGDSPPACRRGGRVLAAGVVPGNRAEGALLMKVVVVLQLFKKGARLRRGSLSPPARALRGPPSCEQEGTTASRAVV